MGGLARRAGWLQEAALDQPSLLLDAGGFLQPGLAPDYAGELAGLILDLYAGMGYAAVGVGAPELGIPRGVLEQALGTSAIDAVCSNFSDEREPSPLQAVKRLEVGGRQVVVLGIAPEGARLEKTWQQASLGKPQTALQEALQSLEQKPDLVVLLSSAGEAVDSKLARQVPGIDLIIPSRPNLGRGLVDRIGRTWILRTASKGKTVGKARVVFDPEVGVVDVKPELIKLDASIQVDRQVAKRVQSFEERTAAMTKRTKPARSGNPFAELLKKRQQQSAEAQKDKAAPRSNGSEDNPFLKLIEEMKKKEGQKSRE